ncbi:MAG: DUF2703 domain-containing protein [Eubacteriales bacterium]
MKVLKIEWKHISVDGDTCDRCYDTGENLANEVKRLKRSFEPKGISIEMKDTIIDESQVKQSNTILFNDIPIEEILDIKISDNYCESCSNIIGKETYCRTVEFEGSEYEEIPAKAIRQAAYKVLGFDDSNKKPDSNGCCCGNSNCCN